jgi:hypothetical protein
VGRAVATGTVPGGGAGFVGSPMSLATVSFHNGLQESSCLKRRKKVLVSCGEAVLAARHAGIHRHGVRVGGGDSSATHDGGIKWQGKGLVVCWWGRFVTHCGWKSIHGQGACADVADDDGSVCQRKVARRDRAGAECRRPVVAPVKVLAEELAEAVRECGNSWKEVGEQVREGTRGGGALGSLCFVYFFYSRFRSRDSSLLQSLVISTYIETTRILNIQSTARKLFES